MEDLQLSRFHNTQVKAPQLNIESTYVPKARSASLWDRLLVAHLQRNLIAPFCLGGSGKLPGSSNSLCDGLLGCERSARSPAWCRPPTCKTGAAGRCEAMCPFPPVYLNGKQHVESADASQSAARGHVKRFSSSGIGIGFIRLLHLHSTNSTTHPCPYP